MGGGGEPVPQPHHRRGHCHWLWGDVSVNVKRGCPRWTRAVGQMETRVCQDVRATRCPRSCGA